MYFKPGFRVLLANQPENITTKVIGAEDVTFLARADEFRAAQFKWIAG